jgi:hypothetical protein
MLLARTSPLDPSPVRRGENSGLSISSLLMQGRCHPIEKSGTTGWVINLSLQKRG